MAFPKTRRFVFRIELPDGPHVATHLAPIQGDLKKPEVHAAAVASIKKGLAQNDDAVLDEDSIQDATTDYSVLEKMVEQLRAENPARPLADDLGVQGQILAKPEVARTIAAANKVQEEA